MEKFKFKDWVKCLPTPAADILIENGFDTFAALTNAKEEDFKTLGLKPGHAIATIAHVRELKGKQQNPAEASQPQNTSGATLDSILAGISSTNQAAVSSGAVTGASGTARMDLDPTVFLRNRKPAGGDVLQIIDFVFFSDASDGEEIEVAGGVFVRLKKPKSFTDVSPAQYLAANSRILATLLESGRLGFSQILDYLAYTAKIGEFATRFTWASVLQFDKRYREDQAAFGFRWGSDSQHLATLVLKERQNISTTGTGVGSGQRRSQQPGGQRLVTRVKGPGGVEICDSWNRGYCRFSPCRYQHCCSICFQQNHQASSHSANPPPPSHSHSHQPTPPSWQATGSTSSWRSTGPATNNR